LGFLRKAKAALFLAPDAALSTDIVAAAMVVPPSGYGVCLNYQPLRALTWPI
jgi:hypothetical protein